MTRLFSTVAALALLASPALADQGRLQAQTRCITSTFAGGRTCTTSVVAVAPTAPTAEELAAKAERIAKWEFYCQPRRAYDNEGVIRLVYAKAGCEFGRSED